MKKGDCSGEVTEGRKPPKPKEWEDAKEIIEDLYITKGCTLKDVQTEMERRGFKATERMFKSRLNSWEFFKNTTRKDWQAMAILLDRRRRAGKSATIFATHHRYKTPKDLIRYVMDCRITMDEFLAEALSSNVAIPEYVRCITPDTSHDSQAPQASLRQPLSGSPSKPSGYPEKAQENATSMLQTMTPFAERGPQSHDGLTSFPTSFKEVNFQRSRTAASRNEILGEGTYFSARGRSNSLHSTEMDHSIQKLQKHQYLPLPLPPNPCNIDNWTLSDIPTASKLQDWSLTAMMNHVSLRCDLNVDRDLHFRLIDTPKYGKRKASILEDWCEVSTERILNETIINGMNIDGTSTSVMAECFLNSGIEPSHSHLGDVPASGTQRSKYYWTFTTSCMAACGYGVKKEFHVLAHCLQLASASFKDMIVSDDPLSLTAASEIVTWLQVHEDGPIAGSVLGEITRVAMETLGENSPIYLSLEWMTASAAKRLSDCWIQADRLQSIYTELQASHGIDHRHTLVALYNLSFHLMRVSQAFEEAEGNLEYLCTLSAKKLGHSDLLTVCALSTLSRAQSRRGNYDMALQTMKRALQVAPLGLNHPHRLSLILRLALIYRKLDRMEITELLYWVVLKGRVATLGKQHKATQAAHESLVLVLQQRRRWDAMKGEVQRILVEDPQDDVSDDESWWRRVVAQDLGDDVECGHSHGEETE